MVCFHYLKDAFLPLLFHFILTIYRIFYWGIIALQCCLSLSCTTTWISFMYACISPSWTSLSINYVQDLIPIPSNVQCHRKTGFLKFYKEACFRAPLLSSKEHSSLFRFFMLCLLSIVSCCPKHTFSWTLIFSLVFQCPQFEFHFQKFLLGVKFCPGGEFWVSRVRGVQCASHSLCTQLFGPFPLAHFCPPPPTPNLKRT